MECVVRDVHPTGEYQYVLVTPEIETEDIEIKIEGTEIDTKEIVIEEEEIEIEEDGEGAVTEEETEQYYIWNETDKRYEATTATPDNNENNLTLYK